MTGPEHYREAERLLSSVRDKSPEEVDYLMKRAQVHATLALVAATAGNGGGAAAQQFWQEGTH